MDINLLTLNLGNTRLAIGPFVAGELQDTQRLSHDDIDAWEDAIGQAWAEIAASDRPAIAGAGTHPPLVERLEHIVETTCGQPIQWVGNHIELPVEVLTKMPQQTGVDRVLNIAAAYEQLKKPCVVVDAGTAITIDACDADGNFAGGAILPGVNLQIASLHDAAQQLPKVAPAEPAGDFGDSTEQAILHGVIHGIRGAIKEIVEHYATALGEWPAVIATGGDASLLLAESELIHAISPELTLYGIALAYAEHHIRHESE